jgi:hypothetical protein
MVASEVEQHQQQRHQHDTHQQQQDGQQLEQQRKACWPIRAWQYAKMKPLELAATALESIALVLVVFVQDLAFKQSIPVCAALLTASFMLHGLAYKARQCQVGRRQLSYQAAVLQANFFDNLKSSLAHCAGPSHVHRSSVVSRSLDFKP